MPFASVLRVLIVNDQLTSRLLTLGMRVSLPLGSAFEASRDRFKGCLRVPCRWYVRAGVWPHPRARTRAEAR
jgi:hypothetical protein